MTRPQRWSTLRPSLPMTLPALGVLAAILLSAAGCNTTEGAGRDIKSLGKGVEEAAQDNKPK